jgi:hypothetical protein
MSGATNGNGGRLLDRRAVNRLASARANLHHQLDDVDLCREVARNLEADFLLAHGGLGPNLHFCFLLKTL